MGSNIEREIVRNCAWVETYDAMTPAQRKQRGAFAFISQIADTVAAAFDAGRYGLSNMPVPA